NIGDEIARLQDKSESLTESIFGNLTSWQIARLARHPQRPYTLDYIKHLFTEFEELHGDRHFSDDAAIVGGTARLNGEPVMIIGDEIARLQDKSESLTESIFGNLTSWQIARLARHPQRPYTLDYIKHLFTEFEELHGDRHFSDDAAIVGGTARLNGEPVMII